MQKPDALYYICHIDNLKSILKKGIYSREKISSMKLKHIDIHDNEVLSRRNKEIADGKTLHSYVNLYFQPRNAMLYRLICNDERKNFVILAISPSVLDKQGMFITDRNAASSQVGFFKKQEGLGKIDKKILEKEYWTDSDETKQKMMAEALIPGLISPQEIISIYSSDQEYVGQQLGSIQQGIVLENYKFFLPTFRKRIAENISLVQGDMFFSDMQTFTISVNIKGIMGKGLASRTKYQFPDAYVRYQDDCKSNKLKIGKPTLFKRGIRIEDELADDASQLKPEKLNGNRWFLFFPTKRHWRENSRLEDIEQSLQWLIKNYKKQGITSIALPALGCGLGNLHWKDVGPLMCRYLQRMNIQSTIYLPMNADLEIQNYSSKKFLLNNNHGTT